jgi:hypothetical protein
LAFADEVAANAWKLSKPNAPTTAPTTATTADFLFTMKFSSRLWRLRDSSVVYQGVPVGVTDREDDV